MLLIVEREEKAAQQLFKVANEPKKIPRAKVMPIPNSSPKNSYTMPESDSSDPNDSSDEPYSEKYHQRQALRKKNSTAFDEYAEYFDYSNYSTPTGPSSSSNTMNENSDSLLTIATPNPISELKIVNVTSLPAEKHNEIMNNDDNAMDSIYNHQFKINEIIASTSNASVFGIAKKTDRVVDKLNSLLIPSTSKPYQPIPHKTSKKQNSKLQKLKQQFQSNYRMPAQAQIVDEATSISIGTRKENMERYDEHSNSKFNFNTKMSRRKNALTPLDCEMEFVEVFPPKFKKQSHMTEEQKILSAQLETVKSVRNPNSDLLRKVAFLRVCVNYMMTELEGETFNFGKNITFDILRTKYNSKRYGY